jgi:NAD(P)H dehydrogenase (quinone)
MPDEVLSKMGAPPKPDDPIATAEKLTEFDGILFGLSMRFGMAPAQVKALMDSTGGLWAGGKLVGKPAGIFFATAQQGGGQESGALTFITQLAHHGMIFVPIGYSTPLLFNNKEIHGGSPYGAGTIADGDGSRMPSDLEKQIAVHQGKHFGGIVSKLCV